MNVHGAFSSFHKQQRVVDYIFINPMDIDLISYQVGATGNRHKWLAKIVEDESIPRRSFDLISDYPKMMRVRF